MSGCLFTVSRLQFKNEFVNNVNQTDGHEVSLMRQLYPVSA